LFQSEFSNLIEPRFISGSKAQFINVTRARIQGFEVNLKAALTNKSAFLDAGYTYISPKDLSENDVLKYRPRHQLYLAATVRFGQFFVGGDYRYLSRVERIDEEFKGFIPDADARVAISVLDARVGTDIDIDGASLTAVLNISNLLQYNYVELVGNMAPPRSFVLSLETRL
jgi:iron complex outermembrane receptor protein